MQQRQHEAQAVNKPMCWVLLCTVSMIQMSPAPTPCGGYKCHLNKYLSQYHSECVPQTFSISIIWELHRNTDSHASLQTYRIRNSRDGLSNLLLTKPSKWHWCKFKFKSHRLRTAFLNFGWTLEFSGKLKTFQNAQMHPDQLNQNW